MRLLARANELSAIGRDIVHLEVGEPDFDTPGPIVSAGVQALQDGHTRYTNAAGTDALREAISRHYQTDYQIDVDPNRIFVTAGGSGALLLAIAFLVGNDDEIILSDPKVKAVLINIFGGITRGDEVAKGIVAALDKIDTNVPMILRLAGTNAKEGLEILAGANLPTAETLSDAAKQAIAAAKG